MPCISMSIPISVVTIIIDNITRSCSISNLSWIEYA